MHENEDDEGEYPPRRKMMRLTAAPDAGAHPNLSCSVQEACLDPDTLLVAFSVASFTAVF